MPPQLIAQLIIALGPPALQLVQELAQVWTKPTLTTDEVIGICSRSQKSYDDYIMEAKATAKPTA